MFVSKHSWVSCLISNFFSSSLLSGGKITERETNSTLARLSSLGHWFKNSSSQFKGEFSVWKLFCNLGELSWSERRDMEFLISAMVKKASFKNDTSQVYQWSKKAREALKWLIWWIIFPIFSFPPTYCLRPKFPSHADHQSSSFSLVLPSPELSWGSGRGYLTLCMS